MKRLALTCVLVSLGSTAHARDTGPGAVCDTWPEACESGPVACETCHISFPAPHNVFGEDIKGRLGDYEEDDGSGLDLPARFAREVKRILPDLETADSDDDGFENRAELAAGTAPGDPASFPETSDPCAGGSDNPVWDLCAYDHAYVFKRVHLDFCGHSPSYPDVLSFATLSAEEQTTTITTTLEACLDSEYWLGRDGVLWKMAHAKIRPLGAIKSNDPGEGGPPPGPIPLANYTHDYALFVYTQTGNHDARDVLLADYHVQFTEGPTKYRRVPTFEDELAAPQRRAGLITTRWFFVVNTMFTAVPRTTAAQAYRAYLGLDIGRSQGVGPAFEPNCTDSDDPDCGTLVDYDDKGVTSDDPDCAGCHRTLDWLAYPFSRYHGIAGGSTGVYDRQRMGRFGPDQGARINEVPEAGFLFGEPVADLMEWAEVAAASDQFAKATVGDYWRLLLGHDPTRAERDEFDALWRAFMTDHEYRVERMLPALIETEAYGVP